MFNLDKTAVKFANFNARTELNGEKRTPAADINIMAQLPNDVLEDFAPGLLSFLYEVPKNPDIVEQADPEKPTALRFPQLGLPIDFELQLDQHKITIDYGLGGESNVVLPECKVHKFKLTPQNGGTVQVGFQISAHPDEKQAGWLYDHQQQEIYLSIEAPEVDDTQGSLLESKKQRSKKAKDEAEALFQPGDDAPNPNDGGSGNPEDHTEHSAVNAD